MSQSQIQPHESRHSSSSSPSPQRRDNWHGSSDDDEDQPDRSHSHDNDYDSREYKARVFAHIVHRQCAPKLDPETLFSAPDRGELFDVPVPQAKTLLRFLESGQELEEFPWPEEYPAHDPHALHTENERVELTEPELYVPLDGQEGDEIIRAGQKYHQWRYNEEHGHVTGPYLADVSKEKFEAEVEIVLEYAIEDKGILESHAEELKRDAMRMKRSQDYSDLDALSAIIEDIYAATE